MINSNSVKKDNLIALGSVTLIFAGLIFVSGTIALDKTIVGVAYNAFQIFLLLSVLTISFCNRQQ